MDVVCTEKDPHAEEKITEMIDYPERVTYAGRLDKDSEGLILLTNDGEPLRELEIAGAIGSFYPIDEKIAMKIEGNRIIIEKVVHRIRYAWKPYSNGNLINEAGLPASTFSIPVQQGAAAKQ